ncbi:MAG TPA: hypothetical protein PLM98_17240 [Thiolinea sp.]|nr:hypothetical protein [Thiolinea sp.]
MYLSNTRLISLLLALAALSLCLLWLLTKQTHFSLSSNPLNSIESTQLAAKEQKPEANNATSDATGSSQAAPEQASATPTNSTPVATTQPQSEPASNAAKPAEVAAIPDNLILSEKELKALSTKERKRYQTMLDSLRSMHDQSAQLKTERQRLEQQMNELEQRNQELAKQLEQARQMPETTAENKVKP